MYVSAHELLCHCVMLYNRSLRDGWDVCARVCLLTNISPDNSTISQVWEPPI